MNLLKTWSEPDNRLLRLSPKIEKRIREDMIKAIAKSVEEWWIFGGPYEEFVAWHTSCRAWRRRWYVPR